ncbi:hypothetical protein [Bradyrhizobium sp. 23AC]
MSILIATSLILAHPLKFGFGFGCVLALALQINNQSLLLGKPPFTLDHIALDPPQLVKYCSLVHHDFGASVLRLHVCRAEARSMIFNSANLSDVPTDATFSRTSDNPHRQLPSRQQRPASDV